MQPTTHYHTTSNLDRLRVRVELRKARDGIFQFLSNHRKKDKEEEEKNKTTEEFRRTFEWQEKVYSPKEIIKYTNMSKVKRYDGDDVSVVEEHHLKQFREKIERDEDPLSELKEVTLFTYTDVDGYVPPESFEPLTTSSIPSMKRDAEVDNRRDVDTMYLMACFGEKTNAETTYHEKTLCSIRHHIGTWCSSTWCSSTWCSSAKRKNMNHVTHVQRHFVITSTRTPI